MGVPLHGLLNIGTNSEMFAVKEVTREEQETLTRLEKMLEQMTRLVGKSVKDNELVALRKMRRGNLGLNIQRIELFTKHLSKVKNALTTVVMQQEALDQAG